MPDRITPGMFTPDTSPSTPDEKGGITFTPKRAMTSFENLVALANHQERLREAKRMVWRDKGQPAVELETLEACLRHAATGGFRSSVLAFNIRASLNLVLALLRMKRLPKDQRFTVIRHAIFGSDSFRFAAMLGVFTSVYKFLINALPILLRAINPSSTAVEDADSVEDSLEKGGVIEVPLAKRKARLSLTKRAQMVLIHKRTHRWHAALAGGIAGGLAIMCEKQSRRGVVSQQMFVRGLQGSYNAFSTKRGWYIPHGDVLVFSLACAQILYGFLLRPDTLPKSYTNWVGEASRVPIECVRMNHDLVREGIFDLNDLETLVQRPDITSTNKAALLALKDQFLNPPILDVGGIPPYTPHYAPCAAVHPAISACSSVPFDRFFSVSKMMLPIYGALHFVPAVLFKWKNFVKDPGHVLFKAGVGSIRSSAFLGAFVVIYQTLYCYKHKLHKLLTLLKTGASSSPFLSPLTKIPQWVIDLLVSKISFSLPAFFAGFALFVEEKRRRGELAMYVLPKALESAWVMARGKGYVFRTGKWGDAILTSLGMAMVMSTYQNDPQHLSGLVRRIMYQFIGPN